ncbi:MAG: sigma-70 family RNA polymerase sigma factor [Lentisphaerae bacterium]|nr:MAG: sigma-70 family RNA polymerase sigma factor [Lentisphaerota bacterium]
MTIRNEDIESAIARVKDGDPDAFRVVIEAFHVPIRAMVHALVTTPNDADEIAQETFVFAFHHLHEYRPGSNFKAWLKAIARNKVRAHFKRIQQNRKNMENFQEQMVILRSVELAGEHLEERLEALGQCIRMLPERKEEFLRRVSMRKGTLEELAAELGRSGASVRKEVSRLYERLRECVSRRLRLDSARYARQGRVES